MSRKLSILALAAIVGSSSMAFASEEHTILMLPDAFFPEVTYVQPGDNVRFVNLQGGSSSIVGADEAWAVGPLGHEDEETLHVTGNMDAPFYSADQKDEDGNYSVQGMLSFEPAPLN